MQHGGIILKLKQSSLTFRTFPSNLVEAHRATNQDLISKPKKSNLAQTKLICLYFCVMLQAVRIIHTPVPVNVAFM